MVNKCPFCHSYDVQDVGGHYECDNCGAVVEDVITNIVSNGTEYNCPDLGEYGFEEAM